MDEPLPNPPEKSDTANQYWLYIVLGIVAVNSLILDLFVFFPKSKSPTASGNVNLSNTAQNYCPQGCLDQINLKASASPTIKPTAAKENPTSSPTVTPTPPDATPTPLKTVKEFFVPLGTGTGKSENWTVIDGLGAKIDPADYGNIKQVTFEVSAWIPTGNETVWIRLYNANNYQSIAGSEVTLSGGTATLLTSSPITLTSGNNLYQIQVKTQLQYPVNIDMARIRIKTN